MRSRLASSDRSRRSFRSIPDEHRPLAAQHEHAHVGIGVPLDPASELRDQLAVERVALLGTVENQVTDRAAVLCLDQCHAAQATCEAGAQRRGATGTA